MDTEYTESELCVLYAKLNRNKECGDGSIHQIPTQPFFSFNWEMQRRLAKEDSKSPLF